MDIFKHLNILLTESEDKSKVKESDIPVHPEMETKEQGEISAAEKILKLFQKLKAGSGGGKDEIKDSKPEIPDEMIAPMMKKSPKSSKDKTFEKNKLASWDETTDEKFKKEIDVEDGDDDVDDFDDFDYRQNPFGDDEEDDEKEDTDYDDDRSEDEKLKDTINDAIDSLDEDNKDSKKVGENDGDDSGANWGDDDDEFEGGDPQGGQQGGEQEGEGQQGGSTKNSGN